MVDVPVFIPLWYYLLYSGKRYTEFGDGVLSFLSMKNLVVDKLHERARKGQDAGGGCHFQGEGVISMLPFFSCSYVLSK
jgi:hypothetical protein